MNRKNRTLDTLLDPREEVVLIGLLKAASDAEYEIEEVRQQLCANASFDPYACFRMLNNNTKLLSSFDIAKWLNRQYFKNTMLCEANCSNICKSYMGNLSGEGGAASPKTLQQAYHQNEISIDDYIKSNGKNNSLMLKYEEFLKLILPREDKGIRNLVLCRRYNSFQLKNYELDREAGYLFVRLLELESNLYEELTIRKKRLLEYEWRENKKHLHQRAFTWLQSQSAVPGQAHVSVLGVCRLLCDVKQVLTSIDVERLFHRVNISNTDMLSYVEWERFLQSDEAEQYLNELYIKYFTTVCPGCGTFCQREGGACNNVTCSVCRTTFRCDTKTDFAPSAESPDMPVFVSQTVIGQTASKSLKSRSEKVASSMQTPRTTKSSNSTNFVSSRTGSAAAGNNTSNPSIRISSLASTDMRGKSTKLDYTTLNRNTSLSSPRGRTKKQQDSLANYREKQVSYTASIMSPRSFSPAARTTGSTSSTAVVSPKMMKAATTTKANSDQVLLNMSMGSTMAPADSDQDMSPIASTYTRVLSSAMASPASRKVSNCGPKFSSTVRHMNNSTTLDEDDYYGAIEKDNTSSKLNNGMNTYTADLKRKRQMESLSLVLDVMFQQIDLDNYLEQEKEKLWQDGINIEAAFQMLDRCNKKHIADTDIWTVMHGSEFQGGVTFAGVCALFRDLKGTTNAAAAKEKIFGQLSLAELTQFLFPRQAEEWQNVHSDMTDEETKNILWVVRSTISCPGCGLRTQRTQEGCPQVTCPSCRTAFRCNLIGDDRDHQFRLTMTQRHKLRNFLKLSVDCALEQEELKKQLAFSGESLSSLLLDAFLLISQDKGYMNMQDLKRAVLSEKAIRATDMELLWTRYARGARKLGFVEFSAGLKPFGHN
ncbi:unnamed protein product [Amoebophrya sp. A120]|nr:unnamed protein product [Amoebophrya sp. A120]|eukprot:GSA120T00025036001.1